MNDGGGWLDEWPPTSDGGSEESADPRIKENQTPKAVKITLKLKQLGTVSRLYDLVSYLSNQEFEDSEGDKDGG